MIHNLHILIDPNASVNRVIKAQTELQVALIEAHRRGEHPWGGKRRECPLCQQGK